MTCSTIGDMLDLPQQWRQMRMVVHADETGRAICDYDRKSLLRIRWLLAQQICREFSQERVSLPEIQMIFPRALVVESLEAQEHRGNQLCLIGETVLENSSTRINFQEAAARSPRRMRPNGIVLKGTDQLGCPGFNGQGRKRRC